MPNETRYGNSVFSKTTKRGEAFFITYGFAGRTRKELVVDAQGRYGDEEAARKLLAERRAQTRAKTFVPPKSRRELSAERKAQETTFAQHTAQVDHVYKGKRDKRRSTALSDVIVILNRHFGTKRLRDITARHIDGYVADRSAEFKTKWGFDISGSTLRKELGVLRMMFRFAMRWELIARDPTEHVSRPRESRPKERHLTRDEWEVLKVEMPEWLRPLCEVAVGTGLRLKEATGLRWGDIRWDGGSDDGVGVIRMAGDNKTGSTDPAYFGPAVWAVFERLRGERDVAPTDYIFGDDENSPVVTEKQRKWVAGQFTAASVRAGFYGRSMPRRERVSFHTLRHTCATWMHERGVDPFTAMMVLRHRSVGQTANYSHVSVDQARTAVGKVLPFRRTEQAS